MTLFRRRSYNIASLHVEPSEIAGVSNMTVVLEAPSSQQVMKELDRLVDVLSVRDVPRHTEPVASASTSARMQADGIADGEELV